MSFFDDASWVLIPEGIKEDVVYAQKPTNGLGDLTFTRASDATRTNSAGVIERTPWNLVTFSEMFTDASWTKTQSTITANTITAPNGTLTADTLTASSTFPRIVQTPTIQANQSYRISAYAKAGSASVFTIFVSVNSVTLVNNVQYNLSTGVVTGSGTMQAVGDGWYLCSATFTVGASTSLPDIRFFNHAQGVSGGWSGTNFIYGWGAQLVEGADAKPYFATTNRQDVPRLHYRNADGTVSTCPRLLLEPQRTNSIRNSSAIGAVAGSPGTLPTNWVSSNGGLTQTIVGVGTENGLQYIDLRFNGTSNATIVQVRFDAANQIAASNGQSWSYTIYAKAISQPSPPISYTQLIFERTAAGTLIKSGSQVMVLTSNLQRFSYTRTLDGGVTVGAVDPVLYLNIASGAAYDFTIRIAAPQMELGAYATTFIPTTTAAVTRLIDNFSRNNVYTNGLVSAAGGTWFVDLDNSAYTRDNSAAGLFLSNSSSGTGAGTAYTFGISNSGTSLARANIYKRELGSLQVLHNSTSQIFKMAIKWNGATADVFMNGVKIVNATVFTGTALEFLNTSNSDIPKFINQMALFPTPLTDAQCITLTT